MAKNVLLFQLAAQLRVCILSGPSGLRHDTDRETFCQVSLAPSSPTRPAPSLVLPRPVAAVLRATMPQTAAPRPGQLLAGPRPQPVTPTMFPSLSAHPTALQTGPVRPPSQQPQQPWPVARDPRLAASQAVQHTPAQPQGFGSESPIAGSATTVQLPPVQQQSAAARAKPGALPPVTPQQTMNWRVVSNAAPAWAAGPCGVSPAPATQRGLMSAGASTGASAGQQARPGSLPRPVQTAGMQPQRAQQPLPAHLAARRLSYSTLPPSFQGKTSPQPAAAASASAPTKAVAAAQRSGDAAAVAPAAAVSPSLPQQHCGGTTAAAAAPVRPSAAGQHPETRRAAGASGAAASQLLALTAAASQQLPPETTARAAAAAGEQAVKQALSSATECLKSPPSSAAAAPPRREPVPGGVFGAVVQSLSQQGV